MAQNQQNGLFSVNNDSGMITSLCVLSKQEKVALIKKFLNNLIMPSLNIMNAMSTKSFSLSNLNMIMSVFSSIRIDLKLYDLTIVEQNPNTQLVQECYDRNKFYMLTTNPVVDRKTGDLCVLFEIYKNALTDPLVCLDEIRIANGEVLGYLYMKELVGLAEKNYKNKFSLANRAKMEMFQRNPKMDAGMRDEAAVALAKMAMEFHTNSMLIDNFKDNAVVGGSSNTSDNLNYIKNSSLVMYDPEYNFKMTQLEILNKLLEEADFEFVDMNDPSNKQQMNGNPFNMPGSGMPGDGESDEDSEGQECDSEDDANQGMSRNSAYSNRSSNEDNDEESDESEGQEIEDDPNANAQGNPSSDDGKFLKVTLKKHKHKIFFMKMPPQKEDSRYNYLDSEDERNIDRIQDSIDYGMSKLKGSGISEIFEDIGLPIEIEIEFEKEIITYINNKTNISNSNKYEDTWVKPNIYTRHISITPGHKPIPESFPHIFVIFDQSGSMTNNTIRKINYVIEYFYKKKYDVTVMIHDDDQNADDVEVYEFHGRSGSKVSDGMSLDDLISSRVRAGGTSHKAVFDLMESYIKDVTNSDKKYNINYVLICSDLYSDIESIWQEYDWIRLLENNIFALCPEKDMKLPFGKTYYVS